MHLILFGLSLAVQAAGPKPADGTLMESAACPVAQPGLICERVSYAADGLRLVALLDRPRDACAGGCPLIVYVRGSYVIPELSAESRALAQRLARAGFAVLSPLLRGSGGSQGSDEMGGADMADLVSTPALSHALAPGRGLDAERLFLYGESRGGMMVFQALRDGFPARAAATFGAFTDFDALLEETPGLLEISRRIWPDFDVRRGEIALRRSARRWAGKLKTPLLLMHGAADRTVPVSHALALAGRLASGPPSWSLRVFAGAGHDLSGDAAERDRTAAGFFRAH